MKEKRFSLRIPVDATVYVRAPGHLLRRCRVANISESGVFIEWGAPPSPIGPQVELVFVERDGTVRRLTRRKGVVMRRSGSSLALMFPRLGVPLGVERRLRSREIESP